MSAVGQIAKGVALRGILWLLGLAALLIGLGFLTQVAFTLLAQAYDPLIAGVIFGLGYATLGAILLALAKPASEEAKQQAIGQARPNTQSPVPAEALFGAFFDGVRQGRDARH